MIKLTHRQAEALWVAREEGSARNLAVGRRGGARRIFYALQTAGLILGSGEITPEGLEALQHWEAHHDKPLQPLTRKAVQERLYGK